MKKNRFLLSFLIGSYFIWIEFTLNMDLKVVE
jgi:hypothetical protein